MKKFILTVEAEQWDGAKHPSVVGDVDMYTGMTAGYCYKGFKINPGDWMVKFPNHRHAVMTDAEFSLNYKPYYGSLPVDQELARLYNSVSELDNEVVRAKFGGNGH